MPDLTVEESAQLQGWFTHHPPTPEQAEKYETIRHVAWGLAITIMQNCPPCADRTAALRKVRDAVMTANASIACQGK